MLKRTLMVSAEICVSDSLAFTGADGFISWGAERSIPVNADSMDDSIMMEDCYGGEIKKKR